MVSPSLKHAAACTADDITARRHLGVGLVDNVVEPADGFAGQFGAYRPENGQIASHQIEPRQAVVEPSFVGHGQTPAVERARVDLAAPYRQLRLDV